MTSRTDQSSPSPAHRKTDGFFAFTTRRPVAILMVVMAVAVFGWVSYTRLSLTLMPDISYPTLTVHTEFPGTAPEEVETLVSRRLEAELGIVPNLVSISSISKAGQSDIIMEFAWGTDMATVAQDIREKIDRVRLPDAAERPLLLRYDPSLDPILRLGLAGPQSLYELRYLADHEIKRRLEAVAGIAAVKVKGGLEEEFQIALDEQQLALLRLDIQQVINRLAQNNINLPGGNLREGQTEYLVRTLNEFRSLEEIADLIVARQNGANIRLRDIATVRSSHKEREVITRVNGVESIEIEIYKEAGANVVEVADRVRDVVFGTRAQQAYVRGLSASGDAPPSTGTQNLSPEQRRERRMQEARRAALHRKMTDFIAYSLPQGASIDVLSDQSVFIRQSIDEVKGNALVGGLIAIAVLYLFLRNLAQTFIVGVTIPISIVATFAPMYLADVSLNIISLGGLALGVGMLVDNAIVVLESIHRCREEGDGFIDAVVRGTSEVGTAVTASTLTTVAVFFPIVFVEGIAGQIFGDMALTVVFSLLASLVVALFFIPMLASRRLGHLAKEAGEDSREAGTAFLAPSTDPRHHFIATVGRLIGAFLIRVIWGVGTLAVLLGRCAAAYLIVFTWPLWRPVEWWRQKRSPTDGNRKTWLARAHDRLRGARPGWTDRLVWPGIAAIPTIGACRDAFLHINSRIRATRGLSRLGWCALWPVAGTLILLRFAAATVLRLLGGCLHLLALLLALPVTVGARVGAAVLAPMAKPVLSVSDRLIRLTQSAYVRFLDWALARPAAVIATAALLFVAVVVPGLPRLGRELIPQVHQGEFNLDITMPVGTPLERTAEVAAAVERAALNQPEVIRTASRIGTDRTASSTAEEGEHTGKVMVRLADGSTPATEEAVIRRIRTAVRDIPEMEMEVSYPALFTFRAPIEVEIRGYDLTTLRRLSLEAQERLNRLPGLADVRSTLQAGNPELQVIYNRDRLADFGLSLGGVAELVRNKIQGYVATDFRRREQQIDILVRLREEDRFGIDELRHLVVNPGAPVSIPLDAVARIQIAEGPSEIRRVDQQRTALITANTDGIDLGTATALIESALSEMAFPPGFRYLISGQREEMQTSINSLVLAFGLALFLVYIVMASQFESLLHPLIIMFTVPLALIGVVAALWLLQVPISVIVFIGLIMLAGIVVNNAIVLIDFINTLRRSGMALPRAVREAAAARLRPILMTTLTTVLGLTPMALGLGESAEIRTPMAITVIAGLTTSTLLTLIVIPCVYLLIETRRLRTS
ncbi:MAG: efflux RND transporter permease subunit [Verrucomicrobia bacterium]|nr:MAG: efflux RND transporter permease subunit [Verrucomicrobiota bacterium]